jgi:hypothetical protein
MTFCSPQRLGIAVVIGAVALSSCSSQTASTLPSSQSATSLNPMVRGATYPFIGGTYVGTWKETGASGSESGPIKIRIGQYLNYLSGSITLKFPTNRAHLRFTGFLKVRGKHLGFRMRISRRRGQDRGHAAVDGSKLAGTIVFSAHGTVPKIVIAFSTVKKA